MEDITSVAKAITHFSFRLKEHYRRNVKKKLKCKTVLITFMKKPWHVLVSPHHDEE